MSGEYEGPFPNDGWILINLEQDRYFKVKPNSHLTADLVYKDSKWVDKDGKEYNVGLTDDVKPTEGKIWRCYWENG